MRRFIVTGTVGAVLLMVGHLALSLGLHPERLSPIASLVQGCLALVMGTALFASGMIGLADGYERAAGALRELLPRKQAPEQGLDVSGPEELDERERGFWAGYQRAAAGICLFLAGLFGLTLTLAHSSLALYTIGVGVGVAALAAATVVLSIGGMRRMRRSHVAVARSAAALGERPDRVPERPAIQKRRLPAYSLFKRRGGYGREVEGRRSRVRAVP